MPTEYSHEFRAELVYDLCAALVREGLATCDSWKECGENALVFAKSAIMRAIGEERWNLLQRNVEYHLDVSDVADCEGFDEVIGHGQLAVTVACGGSGYLKIGPAIEALEAEEPGLGAAFYWTLTYALYRVMRVYNHGEALQYEERLQEYAEEDEEENKGQYEFPEVEKALPDCIRLLIDAKTDILSSGDFLPAAEVAKLAGFSTINPSVQPNKWKRNRDIFAIQHGRDDYFPLYALNPDDYRPRKQMAEILRIFGQAKDGWGLAFWFAALNSFLDDERPRDVLAVDPDRVIAAAKDEVAGVQHG